MVDFYDIGKMTTKMPQSVNQDTRPGSFKGIVVDVRDPFQLGRVRVWAYSMHGDLKDLKIETIPWAEPKHGFTGSFDPPDLFDRVWMDFEGGDRYAPTYFGCWYAIPCGRGTLPYDRKIGSEVRPEAWNHHDLYPETNIVAMANEGNGLWFNAMELDGDNLISSITMMDTGSKFFRSKSIHIGESDYAPDYKITGSLYQQDIEEGVATRDGLEGTETDPVPGSIELGSQHLKQQLVTSDDEFTVMRLVQDDDSKDLNLEMTWIEGNIHRLRQRKGCISGTDDALFLTSPITTAGVFASNMLVPPKRWDV
jgi:hypothetical protein